MKRDSSVASGLLAVGLLAAAGTCAAASFALPPAGEDIVGELRWVTVGPQHTLSDVARQHGLGFRELLQANPGVDAWVPAPDSPLLLPTRFVLPQAPREGIVINIAEMRLYYYLRATPNQAASVMTFPVSVGRDDWKTPLGSTHVKERLRNPVWRPPQSIRAEHAAQGEMLPEVVPAGPDNPLGPLALRLGWHDHLIHGTNKPFGIGMPVTHGCVRMYPEDIAQLFERVPVGTPVRFVDQPLKIGRAGGLLHVEAHAPLSADLRPAVPLEPALSSLRGQVGEKLSAAIDWTEAADVLLQRRGVPMPIEMLDGGAGPVAASVPGSPLH